MKNRICCNLIVITAVLLISISPGWTLSPDEVNLSKIDGHAWAAWPEHTRVIILMGVVVGMNMNTSTIVENEEMYNAIENKNIDDKGCTAASLSSVKRFYVTGVSIEQLVHGINQMYDDPKTRNIGLADAVYFVRRWILGASKDEFQRMLRYLKEGKTLAAAENLVVRNKDGSIKEVIKFP